MKVRMKTLALFVFTMIASIDAVAEWFAKDEVDEFTDERQSFVIYEGEAHRIQINRQETKTNPVAVWFFVHIKDHEQFDPETKLEVRIDDYETRVLEVDSPAMESVLGKGFIWQPKITGGLIWHGSSKPEDHCGVMNELLTGSEMKVRYSVNDLQKRTFTVPLAGARDAIQVSLNLAHCPR